MRLKIPPKEALIVLDQIIKKGFNVYAPLILGDEQENHLYFKTNFRSINLFLQWYEWVKENLNKVFVDFNSSYKFLRCIEDLVIETQKKGLDTMKIDFSPLLKSLDILAEYADHFAKDLELPLFYISHKAQLCFYSSICQLEPDSNESLLAKFLFENYSFNEFVEMETIYEKAFGGEVEKYDEKCATKIKNAMTGLNEKAKEAFGFSVVKKQKSLLALTIPVHLLATKN